MPNSTYRIKIDNEEAAKGSLYEDWDFEAPKQIRVRAANAPVCRAAGIMLRQRSA